MGVFDPPFSYFLRWVEGRNAVRQPNFLLNIARKKTEKNRFNSVEVARAKLTRFSCRIRVEKMWWIFGEYKDCRQLVRPYAGAHQNEFASDVNPF